MITIRIRKVENGFLLKFYRGFWEIRVARCVAKNDAELLEVIQTKLIQSFLDFEAESE